MLRMFVKSILVSLEHKYRKLVLISILLVIADNVAIHSCKCHCLSHVPWLLVIGIVMTYMEICLLFNLQIT